MKIRGEGDYVSPKPTRDQVGWYLFSRLVTVTLLLGATVVYRFLSQGIGSIYPLSWLFVFVGLSYIQLLFSYIIFKKIKYFSVFVQLQHLWDLLSAILFIYLTGGVESPFAFLFILLILSAAGFFSRRESLVVASASAILYGSLLDLQYFGYVEIQGLRGTVVPSSGQEVLYTLFANLLAFFLSAVLGGVIAERLRSRENELASKEIDFKELDSLNRAVVSNMGSGVMTLTYEGRIRVFNQGAERITGRSLVEVYDRDVRKVFPDLLSPLGEFILTSRGEGILTHIDGTPKVIGFATSQIESDSRGMGLLIVFQDLTRLKEIEAQLRRNERLAAIGQMAAGLAHEIRNPLASISGSVQMLLENEERRDDELRLLHIVSRGSDRLNHLLSDFLRFARPAPPELEPINLAILLRDVVETVQTDSKFLTTVLHFHATTSAIVACDRSQIVQVLLNLLLNAADAAGEGGDIWLELLPEDGRIVVEDSGPGIPHEIRERVFDPFFTTKENGTGLGLATVHAIIEAHRWRLMIESGRVGGARFVIVFQTTECLLE